MDLMRRLNVSGPIQRIIMLPELNGSEKTDWKVYIFMHDNRHFVMDNHGFDHAASEKDTLDIINHVLDVSQAEIAIRPDLYSKSESESE